MKTEKAGKMCGILPAFMMAFILLILSREATGSFYLPPHKRPH